MSNYIINMSSSFNSLTNIDVSQFSNKSILIIGAGWMANQYANALYHMKIKDVTILSQSFEKASSICKNYEFIPLGGGFEKNMSSLKNMDLVIISLPIHLLIPATKKSLETGQNNILVEKPGSIHYQELSELAKISKNQKIRIAYNRLAYPNFHLLKDLVKQDDGILSCNFSFTEWIHAINFHNNIPEVYERWGIVNSLHVISMVVELIGFPKKLSTIQKGSLDWHPSGSIFIGSGVSEKEIPFSYHSNWDSGGRWLIEVTTKENLYRLMPLEELSRCPKGSTQWENIEFHKVFPNVKQGLAEEVSIMLMDKLPDNLELITVEKAAKLNLLAEKIFGY